MKLPYHKNLDGVRAIAAWMVMVCHYFANLKMTSAPFQAFQRLTFLGQTGVTLFFVLSGFLITRILMVAKKEPGYFRNFYARRSLRIFPLYYFFLLIYFLGYPLIFSTAPVPAREQWYYYAYLQNIAITFHWPARGPLHFWSLAIEEHFYLLWPLLVYFCSRRNLSRVIAAILLLAIATRFFMVARGYEVFYFTLTQMDSLAIGAILSILEDTGYFSPRRAKTFVQMMFGILVPCILLWSIFSGLGSNLIQVLKYTAMSFVFFAGIGYLLSIDPGHVINRFLKSPPLQFSGRISYGLYVYHLFAFSLCKNFIYTGYESINFFICIAGTYLLATTSYYLLEKRFLLLKKYFESRQPAELGDVVINAGIDRA